MRADREEWSLYQMMLCGSYYIYGSHGFTNSRSKVAKHLYMYVCVCGMWFLRAMPSMCASPCPSIYYVGSVISVLPDNITTTRPYNIIRQPFTPYGRNALTLSAFGGSTHSVRISKYYIHFHDMHHMSKCLVLIV